MVKKEIVLHMERETKGTVLFKEVDSKGNPPDNPVVRNIYITKPQLAGARPSQVKLTIQW